MNLFPFFLDRVMWKSFRISSYFSLILPGKRSSKNIVIRKITLTRPRIFVFVYLSSEMHVSYDPESLDAMWMFNRHWVWSRANLIPRFTRSLDSADNVLIVNDSARRSRSVFSRTRGNKSLCRVPESGTTWIASCLPSREVKLELRIVSIFIAHACIREKFTSHPRVSSMINYCLAVKYSRDQAGKIIFRYANMYL